MRTLITGASGFVGRWIANTIAKDDDVTEIDLVEGYDAIQFFKSNDSHFDRVFHCAAIVGGRATIDGDPLAVATNLALDSWAFRWALKTKVDQFVYFSSSAAYPIRYQQRARLGAPDLLHERLIGSKVMLEPDNTYGLAKLVGERLAEEAAAEGLKTYVFRPFSGYGPDQSLDYPFPSFIRRAVTREPVFDIWGDGTQTRDWIHIEDIVDAVAAALDQDVRGPVNLCTGVATSFLNLAAIVLDLKGHDPRIEVHPEKPTGVWRRVGDPRKLHEFYTPKITIEQGVAEALASTRWNPHVPR